MANTFFPKPTIGGSLNTWGLYIDMIMRAGGQGALTSELYNDSGTLKLSKGKIGIDDDTVEGVSEIDTITTISTVGGTAGSWHAVKMSVSGSAVTISIAVIAAATDESTIPASVKAAYDYEKAGYYLTGSERLIGVVFLRAALALGRIVNCESGKLGFKGITIERNLTILFAETLEYIAEYTQQIGAWDMDTDGFVIVSLPFSFSPSQIRHVSTTIINDAGNSNYTLEGAGYSYLTGSGLVLNRDAGGIFDNANFNSPGQRGYNLIKWAT